MPDSDEDFPGIDCSFNAMMRQPPVRNGCGFVWEAPLDADGRSVLALAWILAPTMPHLHDFDMLVSVKSGSFDLHFAGGHRLKMGSTNRHLVPAYHPFWMVPDPPGWEVFVELTTWPRFKRNGADASFTRVYDHEMQDPPAPAIYAEWVESLHAAHTRGSFESEPFDTADPLRSATRPHLRDLPDTPADIAAAWNDPLSALRALARV